MNLYGMVGNNPVNRFDVHGLFTFGGHKAIVELAMAGISAGAGDADCRCLGDEERKALERGLRGGSIWPDQPEEFDDFFQKIVPENIPILGLALEHWSNLLHADSLTTQSHYGRLQYWHSMWDGVSTANQLQQNIVDWVTAQAHVAARLLRDERFEAAGYELGKGLHTVQDSFSASHVVRLGFHVVRYQDYRAQKKGMHGVPDAEGESSAGAVAATRRLIQMLLCHKTGQVREFLTEQVYVHTSETLAGGSDPAYAK